MAAPANNGQISPPNTPMVDAQGRCSPEWYRYFVKRQATADGVNGASLVTLDNVQSIFPNSRQLVVADGELTETTSDTAVTLGLADTAVEAGTYGQPTRILVLAIDTKGRITNAEEIRLSVDDVEGALAASHGGTGQTTYTVGDLLYASSTSALSRLADVSTGNVLLSGGVGVAPLWGKVNLASAVTGTLPAANGGFPSGGFSGSGTYTNFTFSNGLCTAAS